MPGYTYPGMDDIDLRQRQRISATETARRRKHVRRADAENRLEGIARNPATDPVFEAYIRGEIGYPSKTSSARPRMTSWKSAKRPMSPHGASRSKRGMGRRCNSTPSI